MGFCGCMYNAMLSHGFLWVSMYNAMLSHGLQACILAVGGADRQLVASDSSDTGSVCVCVCVCMRACAYMRECMCFHGFGMRKYITHVSLYNYYYVFHTFVCVKVVKHFVLQTVLHKFHLLSFLNNLWPDRDTSSRPVASQLTCWHSCNQNYTANRPVASQLTCWHSCDLNYTSNRPVASQLTCWHSCDLTRIQPLNLCNLSWPVDIAVTSQWYSH